MWIDFVEFSRFGFVCFYAALKCFGVVFDTSVNHRVENWR